MSKSPLEFATLKVERKISKARPGSRAFSFHTQEVPTFGYVPQLHAIGLTTRKAYGEAAEAAFLAKASSLGFGVARAWGDSERYDFILDAGHKLWRVQVKSTRRFVDSHYVVKCRGNNRRYATGEIDFIAVYIVPKDLWYVIPVSIAELHEQIYFFPQRRRSRGLCEIYREAWCQMACPRDGASPGCIRVERRCQQEPCTPICKLRQQ